MKIYKWQVYLLLLLFGFCPFILYRLHWLYHANRTTAYVACVNAIGLRTTQYQPIFRYTAGNYTVIAGGHYHLPYQAGDSVEIFYNPANHFGFRVNTWQCRWLGLVYWLTPFFLFVTIIFWIGDTIPDYWLTKPRYEKIEEAT